MTDETRNLSPRLIRVGDPVPKGGGVYKLGDPYLAGGKWYTPVHDASYDQMGRASWYGDFFHGRQTANGEIYDMNRLSAAHPTMPLPTYASVTNLENNRTIVVRVNDRGPYHSDRIIDLSRRAAEVLGFYGRGTAHVRVRYFSPAPMNGDDSLERSTLAKQPWATQVVRTSQVSHHVPAAPSTAGIPSQEPAVPATAMLANAVSVSSWKLVTQKGDFEKRSSAAAPALAAPPPMPSFKTAVALTAAN